MPTVYNDAPTDVYTVMEAVMREHYPHLDALGDSLRIEVLMAHNAKSAPIKIAGAAATAKIKRVSAEERSNDGPCLRLLIDASRWEECTRRQCEALMHHELHHIEPKYDDAGQVQMDDYGLAAVKLRPDDWVLTGFEETARLFGDDSLERRAVEAVHDRLRQMALPFSGADSADTDGRTTSVVLKGRKVARQAQEARG